MTVINTENHTKIKDITVSGPKINGETLQSHTNYVSPDHKFYYAFATVEQAFGKSRVSHRVPLANISYANAYPTL